MGVELAGSIGISRSFSIASALTLSRNKINAFTQFYDNFDSGVQDTERLTNTDLALSPNILGHIVLSYAHPSGLTADWIARYVSDQYLDNTQSEDRKIDAYFTNDARLRYLPSRQLLGKEVEFSVQITNIFSTLFASNGYTFSYTSGGEFITENFVYPQAVANFMGQVRIRF
jgi:iron complex outermembrane receptor protein